MLILGYVGDAGIVTLFIVYLSPMLITKRKWCCGGPFFHYYSSTSSRMIIRCTGLIRRNLLTKNAARFTGIREFAIGGKSKKGSKGGAISDGPITSSLDKEVKATTVVGANILKDGVDPKVLLESDYPQWIWHLLDKRPALSELKRMNLEIAPYEELQRYVKLDNRARIKTNNALKAKK